MASEFLKRRTERKYFFLVFVLLLKKNYKREKKMDITFMGKIYSTIKRNTITSEILKY